MLKRKIAAAIGATLALATLATAAPTVAQATETLPAQSQRTEVDPRTASSSDYSFFRPIFCWFLGGDYCKKG
jgi:hypothetical protein